LAVLVQFEALGVDVDLVDSRHELRGQHRQIVACAFVGEVVLTPDTHGVLLPSWSPRSEGIRRDRPGAMCVAPLPASKRRYKTSTHAQRGIKPIFLIWSIAQS